jgi:DNA-directed RNA polymerase specialized sigma24 family protein
MKYHDDITPDDFDALLALFSDDREVAGEKYEVIRSGLVRYFQFKGCSDPLSLADETINRVASKVDTFDSLRSMNITSYFYGFASNILLEYRRTAKRNISITETEFAIAAVAQEPGEMDDETHCLMKCIATLPVSEQEMIVEYYACEREDKKKIRKQMCDRIECTAATLHTKIFRIKTALRACVENCLRMA